METRKSFNERNEGRENKNETFCSVLFFFLFFFFPPEQGNKMKSYLQTATEDKRSGLLLGRSTTEKKN